MFFWKHAIESARKREREVERKRGRERESQRDRKRKSQSADDSDVADVRATVILR